MTLLDDAVIANHRAFLQLLPTLLNQHRGKFALLMDRVVVGVFDSEAEAIRTGLDRYGEAGLFSVQEVTDRRVDLGFFSRLAA